MAGRDNSELGHGHGICPEGVSRPREWHRGAAASGRGGECKRSGCREQRGNGTGKSASGVARELTMDVLIESLPYK